MQTYLGAAQKVFVTEDSMTMLTEAAYSQCPVISLRPREVRATGRYSAMIERFAGEEEEDRDEKAKMIAEIIVGKAINP